LGPFDDVITKFYCICKMESITILLITRVHETDHDLSSTPQQLKKAVDALSVVGRRGSHIL
jgi:hypothetical protein